MAHTQLDLILLDLNVGTSSSSWQTCSFSTWLPNGHVLGLSLQHCRLPVASFRVVKRAFNDHCCITSQSFLGNVWRSGNFSRNTIRSSIYSLDRERSGRQLFGWGSCSLCGCIMHAAIRFRPCCQHRLSNAAIVFLPVGIRCVSWGGHLGIEHCMFVLAHGTHVVVIKVAAEARHNVFAKMRLEGR